jgi:hypothetical protein
MAQHHEEHYDVWIRWNASAGKILTGGVSHDGDQVPVLRVFGAEFEDVGGNPFADHPGFQAFDETFSPNQDLQINITDAVTIWNGNGFDPTAETLTVEYGPQFVTSGAGYVEGFDFAMDEHGGFHGHFEIFAGDPPGGSLGTGIYLLPLSLSLGGPAPGESDPFYFVMNWGAEESEHEAAVEWVENSIPAPGALGVFALAALLPARRRRR